MWPSCSFNYCAARELKWDSVTRQEDDALYALRVASLVFKNTDVGARPYVPQDFLWDPYFLRPIHIFCASLFVITYSRSFALRRSSASLRT